MRETERQEDQGGVESPVISIQNVSRVFRSLFAHRRVQAVQALSLEIRRGEIFGLLGPNGSGKTTTLQMVLGLLSPTEGRISVFGRPPGDSSIRRRIGYLPEEFEATGFLSGEETLLFYGSFFGLARAEVRRRADDLLSALDLQDDRRRRVREYSKGMRRRIGLAQSLLHQPDLLILDEPTNGLDPVGIRKVKTILQDLRARGCTIVISSHILPEMQDICDRLAIMDRGRCLVTGRLGDLLERPGRHLIDVSGSLPAPEELGALLSTKELDLKEIRPSLETLEDLFLRVVKRGEEK
jgi:ABC-2 type transport system ATP-binding protein